MWGWPSAKCPLGTWEKTWTETRMRWLADRFGIKRLIDAKVLLPTSEHFPEPYEGKEADARRFMNRLCGVMRIDSGLLDLEVCEDEQMPELAGLYDGGEGKRTVIRIAESQLEDAQQLVATLAHELAHELLLGGELISRAAWDMEWVTDLTPVFFGLGVFAANATVTEVRETSGNRFSWQIRRHGYLPARVFGYAFALFAFMRNEIRPSWANFLRLDASSPLAKGLRFLDRGGETLFHPDTVREKRKPYSSAEASRRLRDSSASIRLEALWEIAEHPPHDPALLPEIERCLVDCDPELHPVAAATLSCFGPEAAQAVPALVRVLVSPNDDTRANAATALGAIGTRADITVPALAALLIEESDEIIQFAATALRVFGRDAESAASPLLVALRSAVIRCSDYVAEDLAITLNAAIPDAISRAREAFGEDPEICERAIEVLTIAAQPEEE